MDDWEARIAKLRTLSDRERTILTLIEQEPDYESVARTLCVAKSRLYQLLKKIYTKLDIIDLPRSGRQRELARYHDALRQLREQETHPHIASLSDSPETDNPGSSIVDTESEVDESDPEELEEIEALGAVIEDEYRYSIVPRFATDLVQVLPPAPRPPPFRRRQWLLILGAGIVFVVGLLTGSIGTMWLGRRETSVANAPTLPPTASPPLTSSLAQSRPPPTSMIASETPRTPSASSIASAVVCGEAQPITAATNADRFVRDQGVSLFTTENTANGVLSNRIRALAIDQRGLWIGYFPSEQQPSGLGWYDKQVWADCNRPNGVAGVNVNALAVDHHGRLWVATEKQGVAMFDGSVWHTYTITTKDLRTNETFGLTIDEQDNVWVATWGGVAKFDGTEWTVPYTADNDTLVSERIHAIAFDSANGLWVGYIGGPDRIGGVSHRTADNKWQYFAKGKELGGNDVRSIIVSPATADHPESIWIATFDGGISTFAKDHWTRYQEGDRSGLPSNSVWMLALDPYGRIWAGTTKGTAYFDGSRWIRYHSFETLSIAFGPSCQNCPFDSDQVWTGTTVGLTHSRLPPTDQRLDIEKICFESVQEQLGQQVCPALLRTTDIITATYPITLTPGDRFRVEVVVRPRAPYQLRIGDFLSNTNTDDFHLFGVHVNMPVTQVVEPGAPYTLTNPDTPFQAPPLDLAHHEQTFVSTWRMWMHTRYVGPAIRIQFTVRNRQAEATTTQRSP